MNVQSTLSLQFREIEPADYETLARIYSANYPDYLVTATEIRARDESVDKSKYLLKRIVGFEKSSGRILGFGGVANVLDVFHPRKLMLTIFVDPAYHRMGVGGAIYDRLMSELEERGAEIAWVMNREDLPTHREFFERRGFHERLREWESHFDVQSFKPERFHDYEDRMDNLGISFCTLADETRNGEESLGKLHELVQHIVADMPRQAEFTPVPYDQWWNLVKNNPRILPHGYFIAKHRGKFVGMSNVMKNENAPRMLSQDDTGVRREYRGKGIATALKLKVIEFALENGYETIETRNDSDNVAMLAVNNKLGFKRHVAWILLEKNLTRKKTA